MDYRVISIGCLAANPLWGERAPARTGHSTTTLVASGERRILVDPGLPGQALAARLGERANLAPKDITDVFLTSFHPECRRALREFDDADWWVSEIERETVGVSLAQRLRAIRTGEGIESRGETDAEVASMLEQDIAILRRCNTPEDELAKGVSIFPLPGVTPGLCGLLLEGPRYTTVICGDAIPTYEHLEQGRVPPAADIERAKQSYEEALEVADVFIPGRDNLFFSPTKRPF